MHQEHESLRSESQTLIQMSNHMAQIVHSQSLFAERPDHHCQFRLSPLANEAKELLQNSLSMHNVETTFDLDDSIAPNGDPSKTLQLIVNLLTNAKDAVKCREISDRRIQVVTARTGPSTFELSVADNGMGIEAEDVERIFAQGYSTKQTGIGFGLHYCANAAAQMGWKIEVRSDGPNKGATFVLIGECSELTREAA